MSAIVGIDRLGSGTQPADNGLYRSGEVIAGRYIVRELIGVGPLGMVYRTENRQSGGVVALRVVWPDLLTDDASRGRFLKDCIRARTVQNRYVAPLYEAFIDESGGQVVCVLAVKHLGGPTLASRVARRLQAGVPLLALEAQPIVSQIGVGLSAIHQAGLVHGNLRPGSIYFSGDEIRISDLGVASALPAEIVALAEAHAGRGGGRSPEAAAGRRSSPPSDVYAFARLTAQMLGMLSPRSRDDVPVPTSVRAVLQRAMSQNPRDRYSDVDTFAGALVTAFERADQRTAVGLRAVAPSTGETTPKIRTFRPDRSEMVTGALETRPRGQRERGAPHEVGRERRRRSQRAVRGDAGHAAAAVAFPRVRRAADCLGDRVVDRGAVRRPARGSGSVRASCANSAAQRSQAWATASGSASGSPSPVGGRARAACDSGPAADDGRRRRAPGARRVGAVAAARARPAGAGPDAHHRGDVAGGVRGAQYRHREF